MAARPTLTEIEIIIWIVDRRLEYNENNRISIDNNDIALQRSQFQSSRN